MKKNILIIDDDRELCQEITEILETEQYSVDTAHDAEQGLRLVRENEYDVVLLDIKLPGMSGLGFLKCLYDNPPKCRIFIISGASDSQKRLNDEGISHLVTGIISKPFNIQNMLKALKGAIHQGTLPGIGLC